LVDDLGLLYSLYLDEQEKYLQPIAQAFRDHIFEQGSQLVSRVDFSQEEHKEHTKIKEILS
jgi:ABC-type branched-subunit amino acid transport system substrate-binding protein